MRRLRVYADTSVFGGCFDEEFARESRGLFADIRAGKFLLILSATTALELAEAPERVREVLTSLPSEAVEVVSAPEEIAVLRDAYIAAGVVSEGAALDAEHIAAATVADADVVVSWNFKHIVHYDKIRGYNAVNLLQGYKSLAIHSPKEVVES
jgi:hypothetical protein